MELLPPPPPQEVNKIKIKKITDVIKELNIDKIDLMKINIEGGEYDLLFYLIEKKLIYKIDNIQIQFHNFVQEAKDIAERTKTNIKIWNKSKYIRKCR